MSPTHQKSVGTDFTPTIAWLTLAFVFSPAALIVSGAPVRTSLLAMFAGSFLFTGFAVLAWQRYSRLTIPCLNDGRGWWR